MNWKTLLIGKWSWKRPFISLASIYLILILISPLKSVYSIPFKYSIFPGDRYPNLKRIKTIHSPLLVIHSENDEVISYSHGKAIHDASPAKIKSLKPIPDAGHNDMFYHKSDEIFDTIATFINNLPK
jgi:abhydrolase domain-containing protein 17